MALPLIYFFYMGIMAQTMIDPFAVYRPRETISLKKED